MNSDYIEMMKEFDKHRMDIIEKKDVQYNAGIDTMKYFPKGWMSCYTYLNEGLLRLDSLISSGKITEEVFDEKFMDLANYVAISFVMMKYHLGYVKKKGDEKENWL